MCNVFDFSGNIVVIIVQSGLKLYDFTILAAGVEPNKFLIRSPTAPSCVVEMCLFERTEDNLNLNRLFLYSSETITVVRNVRMHHLSLLNAKHKTQLFSV